MESNYVELFKQRKWGEAFDSLPLNLPQAVDVEPRDYVIIRVRASDYNRTNKNRRVSVSINYERNTVIVTASKKQNGTD